LRPPLRNAQWPRVRRQRPHLGRHPLPLSARRRDRPR